MPTPDRGNSSGAIVATYKAIKTFEPPPHRFWFCLDIWGYDRHKNSPIELDARVSSVRRVIDSRFSNAV